MWADIWYLEKYVFLLCILFDAINPKLMVEPFGLIVSNLIIDSCEYQLTADAHFLDPDVYLQIFWYESCLLRILTYFFFFTVVCLFKICFCWNEYHNSGKDLQTSFKLIHEPLLLHNIRIWKPPCFAYFINWYHVIINIGVNTKLLVSCMLKLITITSFLFSLLQYSYLW